MSLCLVPLPSAIHPFVTSRGFRAARLVTSFRVCDTCANWEGLPDRASHDIARDSVSLGPQTARFPIGIRDMGTDMNQDRGIVAIGYQFWKS